MAERRKAEDIIKRYDDGGDTTTVDAPGRKPTAEDIIKRYDAADAATTAAAPDNPYSLDKAWIQIPALHNFAAGVTQGAKNVVATGLQAGNWVNKQIPALEVLDRYNPLIRDPVALAAKMEKERQAHEASPEGQSTAGQVGKIAGEIGVTLPVAGPVGEAAAVATNALLKAAPSLVRWFAGAAAGGGAGGATYGTMTAGGSENPPGEYIGENALIGAALGPPASAAAAIAGASYRGAKGAYKYFTGSGPIETVDAAMDAARARAAAGGALPTPPAPPSTPPAPTPAPTPTPPGPSPPVPAPGTPQPAPRLEWRPIRPGEALSEGQQVATAGDGTQWVHDPSIPPAPQSGGAAVTPSTALASNAPDRAREIAGKVAALDDMISMRPNVGVADFHPHVEGNIPTQAEGLGDAQLASIQRQVEPGNQRYTNMRERAKENRNDHFDRRAGTAEQLDTLEKEIADWDAKTLGPVWANKSPVDAAGVAAEVAARRASPNAQIGPVDQALKEIEDRLFKRGTQELHDDPQMLYGARRHISYLLSKAGQRANPQYADDTVMSELIAVRDAIDKAIEPGAPGFKAWVTEHATRMRDVDRMTLLQAMKPKMVGNGEIQGGRLLTQIKALRTMMARDGANPAHSLTIEDLEMIRDLHRDLLREGNKALSIPINSATSHNQEVAAQHGLSVVNSLLQHGASKVPFAGDALSAFNAQMAAKNAARAKEHWVNRLLEPPPPSAP